jgi:hypothetical protein
MKQFLKKSLFTFLLITTSFTFSETQRPMPSVAEVFGGLSEQEIAEQVQMGQMFLENLKAHGTPEEIEEFNRMLTETLNSMSDDDFKDITQIAEMVKPYIPDEEPAKSKPTQAPVATPAPIESKSFDSNEVEDFKKLINTIVQRIDDLAQKINSSKECSEEYDVKWQNKTTFSNLKRQIQILKTDRLAQKLTKKDASEDDKKLVEALKKFLKELTSHNDSLVIEDNFGLPASHATEQKHVKQTKAYLNMCDDYIDKIMPMLEKFLRKHDPEALQMAKEADEKTKKALKDAAESAKRSGSADARTYPTNSSGSRGYTPSTGGTGYQDYGAYPDYDQAGYPGSAGYGSPTDKASKSGSVSGSSGAGTDAKAKSEIAPTAKSTEEKTDKNDNYANIVSDLEGHLHDDYPVLKENRFTNFLSKEMINIYPDYNADYIKANQPSGAGSSGMATQANEINWVESSDVYNGLGFKKAVTTITSTLKSDFTKEFEPIATILDNFKNNIYKMSADELKKVQSLPALNELENRLKKYQSALNDSIPLLNTKFKKNSTTPSAPSEGSGQNYTYLQTTEAVNKYSIAHESLIKALMDKVDTKIQDYLSTISTIKSRAKRKAANKKS